MQSSKTQWPRSYPNALALLSAVALTVLATPAMCNSATAAASASPATDVDARARVLFSDGNQFWSQTFTKGGSYSPAQLTFFSHELRNVCGESGALTGPFYCPADTTVYLDRAFLERSAQHLSTSAATDYALAYVIGHELGLHIQDLVGTTDLVQEARSNSGPALSARTWMTAELQDDCYAGLWIRWALNHHEIKPIGDPDEVLSAVSATSTAWQSHLAAGETMVDPLLTYGTAALRHKWYQHGLDSGRFNDCDTFSAEAAGKL